MKSNYSEKILSRKCFLCFLNKFSQTFTNTTAYYETDTHYEVMKQILQFVNFLCRSENTRKLKIHKIFVGFPDLC